MKTSQSEIDMKRWRELAEKRRKFRAKEISEEEYIKAIKKAWNTIKPTREE